MTLPEHPFADDAGRGDDPREHRFPSEAEWLQLPWPPASDHSAPTDPDQPPTGSAAADSDRNDSDQDDSDRSFVERTLQALAADQEFERGLDELDRALPKLLLSCYTAPAPSPQFVSRTLQALERDRRQHWQQLLARHVAPEPSPQFVARTLRALAAERTPGASGEAEPRRSLPIAGAAPHSRRSWSWRWPLLALAAGTAIAAWQLAPRRPTPLPFEQRVLAASSPAFAFHHGTSPLAAVVATAAARHEPMALASAGADGLWLALLEDR